MQTGRRSRFALHAKPANAWLMTYNTGDSATAWMVNEMVKEMSLHDRAKDALQYFHVKTRLNGDTFWTYYSEAPGWVHQMVFHAHEDGKILPDDCIYEAVVASLEQLASGYTSYQPRENPIRDLLAWVGSLASRQARTDDIMKDGVDSLYTSLVTAWNNEREDVFNAVRSFLALPEDQEAGEW